MIRTKDGRGWMHNGYRIENTANPHSVGGHAFWQVSRRGTIIASCLPTRREAVQVADEAAARMTAYLASR